MTPLPTDLRRRLAPGALLAAALTLGLAPARAQEPGGGHAPAAAEEAEDPVAEKGPNLRLPAELTGDARRQLEAAIATWERAYRAVSTRGGSALPEIRQAIDVLQAARAADRACALPDYYLGIAYQVVGDHDQAIQRLKEALRRNPRFHEAMVELGDAYRWDARNQAALEAYERAIRTAPDYAHAYYMRALLRVSTNEVHKARQDIERAMELRPDDPSYVQFDRQLDFVLDGPDWPEKFERETGNYVVRTNHSQALCDQIAEQAEAIRAHYEKIFPRASNTRRKFPIVVWKTREEYHRNGGPRGAGGHFDPVFKQLFLFAYEKPADTVLVLYHEGFHQFLDAVLDVKPPQWFNEGLADYFGASQPEAGVMRARPNPWRLDTVKQMIQAGRTTPFERLMNMTQAEMYQPEQAGLHYAQAWSMVYFFCEADGGAHFEYLKQYFSALRRGKTQREAYEAAFGRADMAAVEARWREFMRGVR